MTLDVFVDVTTHTRTTVQEDARDALLHAIYSDCEQLAQALNYRGNVALTAEGDATAIVSGLLQGPSGDGFPEVDIVEENWKTQMIKTRISAQAIVLVTQAT